MTQHAALLDLPEPIALAFNEGRVRDVTTVNELVTAYKSHPGEVMGWLREGEPEITRSAVKLLRAFLGEKFGQDALPALKVEREAAALEATVAVAAGPSGEACRRWRCTGLVVLHRQREGILLLGRRPSAAGRAWIRQEDGVEVDIALAEVQPMKLLNAGE